MVSMVLVIHSAPRNCQMQSTRILLIGGLSEIWEMVVSMVAVVPPEPDPGISNETTSLGKFVATNWSTIGADGCIPLGASCLLDAFHRPGARRLNQFGLYCGRRAVDISCDDSPHCQPCDGQSDNHLNQRHSRPASRRELNDFLIWKPCFHLNSALPANGALALLRQRIPHKSQFSGANSACFGPIKRIREYVLGK